MKLLTVVLVTVGASVLIIGGTILALYFVFWSKDSSDDDESSEFVSLFGSRVLDETDLRYPFKGVYKWLDTNLEETKTLKARIKKKHDLANIAYIEFKLPSEDGGDPEYYWIFYTQAGPIIGDDGIALTDDDGEEYSVDWFKYSFINSDLDILLTNNSSESSVWTDPSGNTVSIFDPVYEKFDYISLSNLEDSVITTYDSIKVSTSYTDTTYGFEGTYRVIDTPDNIAWDGTNMYIARSWKVDPDTVPETTTNTEKYVFLYYKSDGTGYYTFANDPLTDENGRVLYQFTTNGEMLGGTNWSLTETGAVTPDIDFTATKD